jgi:hypothetical protein
MAQVHLCKALSLNLSTTQKKKNSEFEDIIIETIQKGAHTEQYEGLAPT